MADHGIVWDLFTNPAVTGVLGAGLGSLSTVFAALFNRGPALQAQINESFGHLIKGYEQRISDLEAHITELKDHVEDLKKTIEKHGLEPPIARPSARRIPPPGG